MLKLKKLKNALQCNASPKSQDVNVLCLKWEYEDEEAGDYEWEYDSDEAEGEDNGEAAKDDEDLPDPFLSKPPAAQAEKDVGEKNGVSFVCRSNNLPGAMKRRGAENPLPGDDLTKTPFLFW